MPNVFISNTAEAIFDLDSKDTEQDGRLGVIELEKTRFVAGYVPGQAVAQSDMVLDDGWLMHANKVTTERAAPQKAGDPEFDLPETPAFVEQSFTGVAWAGHEYTLLENGWINSFDVWVSELTADTNYRILLMDVTDPVNPVIKQMEEPVLIEDQWTTVTVNPTPFAAGTVIGIILDALNSGSDTTVSGGWDRAANSNTLGNDPGTGAWGTRNNQSSLRTNITDLDTVDRGTELLSIVTGATITIVNVADNTQSMKWTVTGDPVDQTTHVSWSSLDYDGPGAGGEPPVGATCQMTAIVPVPSPTKYEQITDYWLTGQPTWATVRGLRRLGGVDQAADDDAHGVRIQFQPAYISPDWDFMSNAGGGGGGGGGASPISLSKAREVLGDQAANVDWDWSNGSYGFTVALTGNAVIAAPTNPPTLGAGEYADGVITLEQDGIGTRQPTWNAIWKNTPTLTGTATEFANIRYVYDGTNYALETPVEYGPTVPPPEDYYGYLVNVDNAISAWTLGESGEPFADETSAYDLAEAGIGPIGQASDAPGTAGGGDVDAAVTVPNTTLLAAVDSATISGALSGIGVATGGFTVLGWIKTSVSGGAGSSWYSNNTFAELRTQETTGSHVVFSIGVAGSGYLQFGHAWNYTTGNEKFAASTLPAINDGAWHFFACSRDGASLLFVVDDQQTTQAITDDDTSTGLTDLVNFQWGCRRQDGGNAANYTAGDYAGLAVTPAAMSYADLMARRDLALTGT